MVSVQNVGAFLAALSIFFISARFGRRRTIMAACAVFCIGVVLQVIPSHSLVCFYIGRFVAGIGLGAATAVTPSYNVEMAPKEIRARLGSGQQLLFALGVMISYWIDYGVAISESLKGKSAQWQIPVGLQMVPAAVLGFGLLGFPESVRWLASKNRNDEAWASLSWMRADDGQFKFILRRCDSFNADEIFQAPRSKLNSLKLWPASLKKSERVKASKAASFLNQRTRSVS